MRDGNGLGMVGEVLTTFGGRYSGEVVTFEEFQGNRCLTLSLFWSCLANLYVCSRWITVDDRYFTDVRDSMAYVDVPSDLINC